MSDFRPDWLSLREPLDARSRAASLAPIIAAALRGAGPPDITIQVVDLGAGTGANLRYVAPLLGGPQGWIAADQDPSLLETMNLRMRDWAESMDAEVDEEGDGRITVRADLFECHISTVSIDLGTELDRLALPDGALVTASALLDLVSEDWLWRLARSSADRAAPVWFALSYDGRVECNPEEPEDLEVLNLFNRHQRTDKGFGPALGPGAARKAAEIFADHGYRTCSEPSDWRVGSDSKPLQRALLDGWFRAACEVDPSRSSKFGEWRERRRAHIDNGRSEMIVGHVDVIGTPRR